MKLYVAAFSERGRQLAKQIEGLALAVDYGSLPCCSGGRKVQTKTRVCLRKEEPLATWCRQAFDEGAPLLFIGAAGIAVRSIADHISGKTVDSPVLVIDETGSFVIPLLSGHLGGANELAEQIAKGLGATSVITTGTDVNHLFAVDVFARKNALQVWNPEGIAKVSAKLLAGEQVTLVLEGYEQETVQRMKVPKEIKVLPWSQWEIMKEKMVPGQKAADIVIASEEQTFANALLGLKQKQYVLGIGCRRGKSYNEIKQIIERLIQEGILRTGIEDLAGIASIDVKQDEEGIIEFSERHRVPFYVFTKEELQAVSGAFEGSAFVENTVGVDNVCERAAVAGSGGGTLVLQKQALNGVTIAVAKRKSSEQRILFGT